MPTEEELIAERKRKREELLDAGINPYPYKYEPSHHAQELHNKYANLKPEEETKDKVTIAGRIVGMRKLGKLAFIHLLDETGKIQALFNKQDTAGYDNIKLLDSGDWLGVEGHIVKTKTGELTVKAIAYTVLCKSIRPMPEKWHGLKDIEQRYRKRYVDLFTNPEIRETFINRTRIMDAIRAHLNKNNFLEVETPILQNMYGGANARPFKTHFHALNQDVYLRISNELYLKRLIVGGFERVYEFSKDFRNEDIDTTHNPEFTQIEIYQAYADFNDMKELTMDLYIAAAHAVHGSTKFEYQGHTIDVKKPWASYTMVEALKKFADIDADNVDNDYLAQLCREHKLQLGDNPTKGELLQALFEELVEDKLIQPTFITHHPVESTPLCKPCREEHLNEHYIERFEPFIAGMEIANAYSELNDPVLQRKHLEEQAKQLRAGSEEAHPMDEDFIQAIEYGMPPTGGLGIGIDRMTMLLTNNPSIRDVLFFPFMRN